MPLSTTYTNSLGPANLSLADRGRLLERPSSSAVRSLNYQLPADNYGDQYGGFPLPLSQAFRVG